MKNLASISVFFCLSLAFGVNFATAHGAPRQDPPQIWIEVKTHTVEGRTRITELGYEPVEILSDKVYFAGRAEDVEVLKKAGFETQTFELKAEWLNPNLKKKVLKTEVESHGALVIENRFHSYDETVKRLQTLGQKSPQIVEILSLGKSLEGRDIPLIRISGKSAVDAELEKTPSVLIFGCHHAREHLSVEVPSLFAEYLVENYGNDPEVTRLVDSREFYIAPMVNPDGHVFDFKPEGGGRMWRKNRARNSDGSYGVDLNRNYSYGWGGRGASSNPNAETYRGPSAFSEIESQHVRNFVRSQTRAKVLLSVHTFSELVLYPWGHTEEPIGDKDGRKEDLPVFQKMATDMARFNKYTPQQSSDLYVASGDTTDWAYGELGIFAFTFELSPRSMWTGGFYPDPSLIPVTFNDNLKAFMYLAEYADDPSRVNREKTMTFEKTPVSMGLPIASFKDLKI